jgi:hypothetical protein
MTPLTIPPVRPRRSLHLCRLAALGSFGAALVAAGCTGGILPADSTNPTGQPGPGPSVRPPSNTPPAGGPGAPPTTSPMPVTPSNALDVGISGMRRLTAEQYRNTVRDLLKLQDARELVSPSALPGDGALADRFTSNAANALQGLDADKYADLADMLARKAVTNLSTLVGCGTMDAACAQTFIENFGKRAFRRPLTQVEVERYKKVFAAGSDFATGIRLVVQTFLQSPKFIYLVEIVPPDGAGKVYEVDGWAIASRLSYFFLASMPDEPLFAAAEAGRLKTPEQIAEQATRLMNDARFRETLGFFHHEWLELDQLSSAEKDAMAFSVWTPELKAELQEQVSRFIQGVLRDGDGKIETLLTASFTFMKGGLYDLYGLPRPAGAAANSWAKVDLDPKQRSGLLTHAGLMAGMAHENRTSYILRGKMVREAMLCTVVPPPPPGVDASETNIPPTATAQERSVLHRTKPECATCHELFDPLGFAFEIYDAVGRFRASDAAGKPIDSRAVIAATAKIDGTVGDALELTRRLGPAEEVQACVARQWLRFALGRELDETEDASTLSAVLKATNDSGGKVGDILSAVARSNAFRHLKVKP